MGENRGRAGNIFTVLHLCSAMRKINNNLCEKLLEIEKEIVREVALGGFNTT